MSPPGRRDRWKVIKSQELTAPEAFFQFVDETVGQSGHECLKRKRATYEQGGAKNTAEWISWEEAKGYENEAVLKQRVQNKKSPAEFTQSWRRTMA